jgi:hypothetical protein
MKRNEYEQRKRVLDEQLRLALDLVHAGHRAQLQMLELLWRTSERQADTSQAAEPLETPPLPEPQETSPPPPKQRREAHSLYADVVETLPQLPEEFTKNDVIRCLGYSPDRASLFRVLDELQREGVLEMKERGAGKIPSTYLKKHKEASQQH